MKTDIWPELFRHHRKQHDPAKVTAFHECGHSLVQTYFGLIPRETSLIGYRGTNGFTSGSFYVGYDFGINWQIEAPEYAIMQFYGGIVAGSAHSGWYNWHGAIQDLKIAEQIALHYNLDFSEQLRIWIKTHDMIEEYYDLLEKAAEKLFIDKVLDSSFWESEILLSPQILDNV